MLLGQSAAFDTVDHSVPLSRLENRPGITGTALAWFKSYLTSRKQSVLIQGTSSRSHDLNTGEAHGSVYWGHWGHYCIVCTPFFSGTLRRHDSEFHLSASCCSPLVPPCSQDHHWLFLHERCIAEIRAWLACNFLKLNDTETEFLAVGTNAQLCRDRCHIHHHWWGMHPELIQRAEHWCCF